MVVKNTSDRNENRNKNHKTILPSTLTNWWYWRPHCKLNSRWCGRAQVRAFALQELQEYQVIRLFPSFLIRTESFFRDVSISQIFTLQHKFTKTSTPVWPEHIKAGGRCFRNGTPRLLTLQLCFRPDDHL